MSSYEVREQYQLWYNEYNPEASAGRITPDLIYVKDQDWKAEYLKLRAAVRKLYFTAWWKADRDTVNSVVLWEDVRFAAQFLPNKLSKLGPPQLDAANKTEPEYKEGDVVRADYHGVVRLLHKAWIANTRGGELSILDARITGKVEQGNIIVGAQVNHIGSSGSFIVKAVIDKKAWLKPVDPAYCKEFEKIVNIEEIYIEGKK